MRFNFIVTHVSFLGRVHPQWNTLECATPPRPSNIGLSPLLVGDEIWFVIHNLQEGAL